MVWSEPDVTTTYQWRRGNQPAADPDPTDNAYPLTAGDAGFLITVVASGTKPEFPAAQAESAPVGPVLPGILTAAEAPRIRGRAQVGSQLSAVGPVWDQAGVVTTYEWRSDGRRVASGPTFVPRAREVGKRIVVRATGTKAGYTTAAKNSAPTAEVKKVPSTVRVSGSSPRVGALRLSITVSAPGETIPDGTVSLRQGSKVLKARLALTRGRGTYSANGVKPGRYTYSVRYAGTSRIGADTDSITLRVKARTNPSISLTPTTRIGRVRIGISVTAKGQPPLGGRAYVKEGRKTLRSSIKVVRGKATFSASRVKPGRHTYLVGYRGTSQVRPGTKKVTVRVPAPPKLVSYESCAAMQRVHPHGVGRSGAEDSTSGTPVTTFLVNTQLYEYNDGKDDKPGEKDLDRDNDGIACEKR